MWQNEMKIQKAEDDDQEVEDGKPWLKIMNFKEESLKAGRAKRQLLCTNVKCVQQMRQMWGKSATEKRVANIKRNQLK